MRSIRYILLFGALALSPWSFAIVRRHDVSDSAYITLASQVPPVINLDLLGEGKPADGMGVLIAPRWILTAAHLEDALKLGLTVRVDGETAKVSHVFVYPDWQSNRSDIALLRLDAPIEGTAPTPIDRGHLPIGVAVVFAGYGDYGNGKDGPVGNDRTLRAACNRIDEIDGHFLKFRFDAPGDPNVLPLEGISGPGDSGGPAFVKRPSGWFTAGVSSAQSTRATGGKEGLYGVTEYYIWVAEYAGWIDSTLKQFGEAAADVGWRVNDGQSLQSVGSICTED